MELQEAIVEFGTEGVLKYREISGSKADNELPEVFLGSFIAPRLFEHLRCPVHVERLYTVLAQDIGIELTHDLLVELGGLRADIAVYSSAGPQIVELKIFDERKQPLSIAEDLSKIGKLTRSGKLRGYVAAMVYETGTQALDARVHRLEEVLKTTIPRGKSRNRLMAVGRGVLVARYGRADFGNGSFKAKYRPVRGGFTAIRIIAAKCLHAWRRRR